MQLKHFLTLLFLGGIWGASYPLMRVAVPEWGVLALTSMRVLIASTLLFFFIKLKRRSFHFKQNFKHYFIIGILNFVLPLSLFSFAAGKIPAAYSAIINATVPFWTIIIAYFAFQESLTLKMFMGVVVGILGVGLVNGAGTMHVNTNAILGMSAALVASILYAVASSYMRKFASHITPLLLTGGSTAVAGVLLLPVGVMYFPSELPSFKGIVTVFSLAAFCTVVAFVVFYDLVQKIGMTQAVLVTFLVPVFGSLWGFLFLGESLNFAMFVGIVLISIGLALIIYGKKAK